MVTCLKQSIAKHDIHYFVPYWDTSFRQYFSFHLVRVDDFGANAI